MNDAEKKAARVAAEFPKRCGCGEVYTPEQWGKLTFRYMYRDAFATQEARDCKCLSTLVIYNEIHDLSEE